jgi:hypothetical protein
MARDTHHSPQAQSRQQTPMTSAPDDYFVLLARGGSDELPTRRSVAILLFILGGLIVFCALAFTMWAYADTEPDDLLGWQIVFIATGPMFGISALLGGLGAYLIRTPRSHDASDLAILLRRSNGTHTE